MFLVRSRFARHVPPPDRPPYGRCRGLECGFPNYRSVRRQGVKLESLLIPPDCGRQLATPGIDYTAQFRANAGARAPATVTLAAPVPDNPNQPERRRRPPYRRRARGLGPTD